MKILFVRDEIVIYNTNSSSKSNFIFEDYILKDRNKLISKQIINMLNKNSKFVFIIFLSVLVSLAATVFAVQATTTVGNNVSVGGNLTVNGNVGIGTTTPSEALEFGLDKGIKLSTDKTNLGESGLIKLKWATNTGKPAIVWYDENDNRQAAVVAHDYLSYPDNRHQASAFVIRDF